MSRPEAFARPCGSKRAPGTQNRLRIPTEQLRWRCDPESLGFTSTAEFEGGEAGRFHVWAVDRIEEALEIFTGVDASEFWRLSKSGPKPKREAADESDRGEPDQASEPAS